MNQRSPNLPSTNRLPLTHNLPLFIHTSFWNISRVFAIVIVIKKDDYSQIPTMSATVALAQHTICTTTFLFPLTL